MDVTGCAVRVLDGELDQREAMGLSKGIACQGLWTVVRRQGNRALEAETQDEDEVYELQFGRHFGRGSVRADSPWRRTLNRRHRPFVNRPLNRLASIRLI